MKMLVDSNLLTEVLRDRPVKDVVEAFIEAAPPGTLHMSDFALHSVGVVLGRFKTLRGYAVMIDELILGGVVEVVTLSPAELRDVQHVMSAQRLDFDDAYQYAIAERDDLVIVSLDADFDRTTRGRLTPEQALQKLGS